jgi:hypothetical protein
MVSAHQIISHSHPVIRHLHPYTFSGLGDSVEKEQYFGGIYWTSYIQCCNDLT